jgi:hypothetical protein
MLRRTVGLLFSFLMTGMFTSVAYAQPLGVFSWQLAPFCNVVTVTVTQQGGTFTLDGYDNQCGAATRAAVVGTAFPNPNGAIGIGLSVVATPGAAPVHVDVSLDLATIGGPWRDSFGNTGTFVFSPPAPAPGVPRPATGGLISTVAAGAGLTGGGTTGAVSLSVNYGGSGAATTAARSDHTHAAAGTANTAIGVNALSVVSGIGNTASGFHALQQLTTGGSNSAFGNNALRLLTTGGFNTAVGSGALGGTAAAGNNTAVGAAALGNNEANNNTAVGMNALRANENGSANTAVGQGSLSTSDGGSNTAIGQNALNDLDTGNQNIAIGASAGDFLTDGSSNIYLGAPASLATENNTIRLGSGQTRAFIAGTRNVTTANNNAIPVLVDSAGQLGTVSSTQRVKEDIGDLPSLRGELLRLRPVQFRYSQAFGDGTKPLQYGLIAEEVERVLPELVAYDGDGQAASVKYHVLPTLLLAEIQRLERERAEQARILVDQASAIETLREEVRALRDQRKQ